MKDFNGVNIKIGDTIFFKYFDADYNMSYQVEGRVSNLEKNKKLSVLFKDVIKTSKRGKNIISDYIKHNPGVDPNLELCGFVVKSDQCIILNK